MPRIRLDKLIVKRGIANTIEEAAELIKSSQVLVNNAIQNSPASAIDTGAAIEIIGAPERYVSRGGYKLEKALDVFNIDVKGKKVLDVGSSTGGFTDCLLQHGAAHVVAVDVGKGQLDIKLREDERVTVLEKTNAKDISPQLIGGICDLGVMDVSFTSILPLLNSVLNCIENRTLVALIKPQFEVEQKHIDNKGVVRSKDAHIYAITKICEALEPELSIIALDFSPIVGRNGNIEYLAMIAPKNFNNSGESVDATRIDEIVHLTHLSLKGQHD